MKKTKYIIIGGMILIMLFSAIPNNAQAALTRQEKIASLKVQIQTILKQIQILQAQLLQLQGEVAKCNFTRTLYPGLKGEDVKCLQKYLNGAGYTVTNTGFGSPGNESIYYGALTQSAVQDILEKIKSLF